MAAPSRILSDCTYMWERTVMGISVRTAETETATPPYYIPSFMTEFVSEAEGRRTDLSWALDPIL